jgi:hypothetical protein
VGLGLELGQRESGMAESCYPHQEREFSSKEKVGALSKGK